MKTAKLTDVQQSVMELLNADPYAFVQGYSYPEKFRVVFASGPGSAGIRGATISTLIQRGLLKRGRLSPEQTAAYRARFGDNRPPSSGIQLPERCYQLPPEVVAEQQRKQAADRAKVDRTELRWALKDVVEKMPLVDGLPKTLTDEARRACQALYACLMDERKDG